MIVKSSNQARCNICRGTQFEPGPNERKSATGKLPRCTRCRSLERHRQLRQVYAQIPDRYLSGLDVLQLSPDIGVDPIWFSCYEISLFGGDNSLDLEAIDRMDASYDLVICNHVLEHVADDRKGLQELIRIARPEGLIQITVPSPYARGNSRLGISERRGPRPLSWLRQGFFTALYRGRTWRDGIAGRGHRPGDRRRWLRLFMVARRGANQAAEVVD